MSMDHLETARRETAESLRSLEFMPGTDSHERLAQICGAVYEPAFGWTYGACAALAYHLAWLIDGEDAPESAPEAECGANEDDAGKDAIPPITRRLRDAMRYSYLTDDLTISRERFTVLCDEIDAVTAVLEDSLRDARDEAERTDPLAVILGLFARALAAGEED